jgi:septal ring factor EnvC (AmiA/AmiB activator)
VASRSTRALTALLAVLLTITLLPPIVAGAHSPEQRLQEARNRLSRISGEIRQAERDATRAESALADADARLREVEEIVNDVARQLERQRALVRDAEERLAAVEAEAEVVREALADRATRMFKQGPVRELDVLLNARGTEDALARTTMLRALTISDRATVESLEAAEIAVAAERERLDKEREVLDQMLEEQKELLAEVAALRRTRALAAAEAREQVRLLEQEQDDLEAEQASIEALIRRRQEEERRRREAAARAAARSSSGSATVSAPSSSGFAWPVCGRVTSEYGPRWGRMHRGIDGGAGPGRARGGAPAGPGGGRGGEGGVGR